MPWPPRQRAAIAADLARKGKTPGQISAFFHAHGHGGAKAKMRDHLMKSRRKRRH